MSDKKTNGVPAKAFVDDASEFALKTALKTSQNNYQSLVNSVEGIVWQADAKTFQFSFVSRSALKLFGYPTEEWLDDPKFWRDHIHPVDRDKAVSYCTACVRQKISHQLEYRMIAADGRIVYVHDNVSVIVENNKAVLLRGIMTDITERKKAQEQSRITNDRLLFHLENSPLAFIEWDDQIRPTAWSKRAEEIFGFNEKDVSSELFNWNNNVYEDDQPIVNKLATMLAAGKIEKVHLEHRNYTKGRKVIWCAWFNSIVRGNSGKVIGILSLIQDITERKIAEQKTLLGEQRFRSLVQNGSDLIGVINKEGNYKHAGGSLKRITGFDSEYLSGKTPFSLVHPDDCSIIRKALSDVKNKIYLRVAPFRYKNAKGQWRWMESMLTNLLDDPAVEGIIANSRDITEKKIDHEEIEKLSLVARNTLSGVFILDAEERFQWINNAFTKITEYTLGDVIGKRPSEFLYGIPTDNTLTIHLQEQMAKGLPFEEERINYTKSGKAIWVCLQLQVIRNGKGKIKQYFGVQTDITEKKYAENELKKLSMVARETINGVVIRDEHQNIVWVNNAFTKMYGFELDEVIGKNPKNFLPAPATDIKAINDAKEQFIKKEPFVFEILNRTKTGNKIYARIQVQPIFDENGDVKQSFALHTDITRQKELEEKVEIEKITKQKQITNAVFAAQERERAEIGRELHDNVNQLLGATRLYIDMARKEQRDRDSLLTSASAFALSAIEEIRKLSKTLIAPLIKEISLADSIIDLAEEVMLVHPIQILFVAEGFKEVELSDKFKLNIFRIIQEQINNTLKHAQAKKININFKDSTRKLIISITDDGIGFDTTKRKEGVGLINIKSRSELYNGIVDVTSELGKGTSLSLTFNKEDLLNDPNDGCV